MKVKSWKRTIILIAMACAFALASISCGSGSGDGKSDGATLNAEELREFLDRAIEEFDSQESFHFVMDFAGRTTPLDVFPVEMRKVEGDIIVPDQLRATIDAKATDFGGIAVTMQVIGIGDVAWMTNPFDATQWVDLDTGNPLNGLFDPSAGVSGVLSGVQNPRVIGEELINEIPTWRIEGTLDSGDLAGFALEVIPGYEIHGTVWINKETALIHRLHVLGQLNETEHADILRRLDFSGFHEVEPIEPPQ
ncbi:MAG TPA: hypothetical protein DGL25_05110 [Dehalococcoidia bacterium]|nr:hypothetical protein [Dehalococcoidia bacterium]|tara:strand:- start:12862 stop:13611 length:750 start_codon:yes stop_codon:yes gene_type:complete